MRPACSYHHHRQQHQVLRCIWMYSDYTRGAPTQRDQVLSCRQVYVSIPRCCMYVCVYVARSLCAQITQIHEASVTMRLVASQRSVLVML